jgi:hypothetical protein
MQGRCADGAQGGGSMRSVVIDRQWRLQRNGLGRMHEHGPDGSYIEAWKSTSGGEGRFLVIRRSIL